MKRIANLILSALFLPAFVFATHAPAQAPVRPLQATLDAAWVQTFAAPLAGNQTDKQIGRENALNGDPRFPLLLKSSFHQHQWFWYDNNKFTPVAELIELFIGVPGSALLDDNRYVTADGCVPHDCVERGMLWIDTAAHPATVIFVATTDVNSIEGGDHARLWLFASQHLDFQNLPPAFLNSLKRWHNYIALGYKEDIVLATLVQPNGEQVDLTYPTLYFKDHQPGAKK
jgi:hypothetical protein